MYRKKYRGNLHDKNDFYFGIEDMIFKMLLAYSSDDITKSYIAYFLNKRVNDINSFRIESPLLDVLSIYDRKKNLDLKILVNDRIHLNIEMNSSYYRGLHQRNFGYASAIYASTIPKGKKYEKEDVFYHIDVSCNLPKDYKKGQRVNKVMYVQNEEFSKYLHNFIIRIIDMDTIKKLWYQKDAIGIKKHYLMMALMLGREELDELSSQEVLNDDEKRIVKKIGEEIIKMNEQDSFANYISAEKDAEMVMNTIVYNETEKAQKRGFKQGRKKGLLEGIEHGREQSRIETIERMAKEKFTPDVIARCLGVSVSKVEKIMSNIVM